MASGTATATALRFVESYFEPITWILAGILFFGFLIAFIEIFISWRTYIKRQRI